MTVGPAYDSYETEVKTKITRLCDIEIPVTLLTGIVGLHRFPLIDRQPDCLRYIIEILSDVVIEMSTVEVVTDVVIGRHRVSSVVRGYDPFKSPGPAARQDEGGAANHESVERIPVSRSVSEGVVRPG